MPEGIRIREPPGPDQPIPGALARGLSLNLKPAGKTISIFLNQGREEVLTLPALKPYSFLKSSKSHFEKYGIVQTVIVDKGG